MVRMLPATLVALCLVVLPGCDKEPERPVAPPPPVKTAPPPEPVAAAVEPEVPAPVPESVAEESPPKPVRKPRVAKPAESRVPAGFVRMAGGDVTDAAGQRQHTVAYAIAREPVTLGQLRDWAASEGGRRLPQLGNGDDLAVATDLDWLAAEAYARWLADKEHRHYRLPTEMEWLRAAQSGRISTQAQRPPAEPPLWEWTGDCWSTDDATGHCPSRVLVGGEVAPSGNWGRAGMGARRPAASFRLVLELK